MVAIYFFKVSLLATVMKSQLSNITLIFHDLIMSYDYSEINLVGVSEG